MLLLLTSLVAFNCSSWFSWVRGNLIHIICYFVVSSIQMGRSTIGTTYLPKSFDPQTKSLPSTISQKQLFYSDSTDRTQEENRKREKIEPEDQMRGKTEKEERYHAIGTLDVR